jgi:hypothetical protein
VTLAWFPPAGTDGLRPLLDQQQLVQITQAAMTSSQFWILPSAESTGPLTFGDAAREAVTRHGEFTSGQIVPVVPVIGKPAGGRIPPLDKILGKPTGYQVYLEGPAGVTSFGMSPGAKPGTWNLDSRGELLNWTKAIAEVGRDVGFVPTRAVVTHTAFGIDGKSAVILSWLVFTDARGRTLAATLRDLPPTGVTWKLGAEPLQSGALHPFATIFTTVTATPSR